MRRFSSAAFWVSDGKTKVPGSIPSSRKTKPPLRAVNEESQQSRACGALYFVVTFLRTNFWQTDYAPVMIPLVSTNWRMISKRTRFWKPPATSWSATDDPAG